MDRRHWVPVGLRVLVSGLLLVGAWALWLFSGDLIRVLCTLALLLFSGCLVAFVFGKARRAVILSGLVFGALALSPVEVSLAMRSGGPGIVPLEMGLPTAALREQARKGEVVLGGCFATGHEPRWVVIW